MNVAYTDASGNVIDGIKMFTVKPFNSYIADGWKEGFRRRDEEGLTDIVWSGDNKTNPYYTNTILVKSNYKRDPNVGTGYNDSNTFSGYKFLYKPFSATQIQWVLLYTIVHDIDNGQNWYHYNCNLYRLVIDGEVVVDMPREDGEYESLGDPNKRPVLSNGAGSEKRGNSKPGQIPPLGSGDIDAGTTQVTFYGIFTPKTHTTSAEQSFDVEFTYVNWAYMNDYTEAVALNDANWSDKVNQIKWGNQSAAISLFKGGSIKSSCVASITDVATIETLADNYVSYGQTLRVSGGNYAFLNSTGIPDWESGWQATTYSTKLITDDTYSFPTNSRSNLYVKNSFWNGSNFGADWCESTTLKLQYKPNTTGYVITDVFDNDSKFIGISINFSNLKPIGKNGYFNCVKILKSGSGHPSYVVHNFASSSSSASDTITITRGESGTLSITTSKVTDTIITTPESLNVGTDAFTLLIYACYHNAADGDDHSNDLQGTKIGRKFVKETEPQEPPEEDPVDILDFKLMYPVDQNGVTHIIKEPVNETYVTSLFASFKLSGLSISQSMCTAVLELHIAEGADGFPVLARKEFAATNGVNKVVMQDLDFTGSTAKSYELELKVLDKNPISGSGSEDVLATQTIEVSIKFHAYSSGKIANNVLVNSKYLKTRLLNQVGVSISNFQNISDEWNTIFSVGDDVYAWNAEYLNITDEHLITISIKELLEKLIEFYNAMKANTNAKNYQTEVTAGSLGTQKSILKDNSITAFRFNRSYVGTTEQDLHPDDDPDWHRYYFYVYDETDVAPLPAPDPNDAEAVAEYDEHERVLLNQNAEYISGNRYRLTLYWGVDDLILAEDVQIAETQILVFNNY